MKIILLFTAILINAASAQEAAFKVYEQGAYKEIPFHYPAVFSEDDINEVVALLAGITSDEISYMSFSEMSNWLVVTTCSKGTIITGSCHSGGGMKFRKNGNFWQLTENPKVIWAD